MAKKKISKKTTRTRTNKNGVDKAAKFLELASKRMTKALKAIGHIGNLSNRNNYEYGDEQVKQMLTALKKAVVDLEARFAAKEKGAVGGFEFE